MFHGSLLLCLTKSAIFLNLLLLCYSAHGETRITGVDVRLEDGSRFIGTIEFPSNDPENAYVKYTPRRFFFSKRIKLDKEDAKRLFQMNKDPNTVLQIESSPEAYSVVAVDRPPIVEIKDNQATVSQSFITGSVNLDRSDQTQVQFWNHYPIREMRSLRNTVIRDKNTRTYFLRISGDRNLPVKVVAFDDEHHLANVITYPDLIAYLQGRTQQLNVYSVPAVALNSTRSAFPFDYKSVPADIKPLVKELGQSAPARELLSEWERAQTALDKIAGSRRDYVGKHRISIPNYQDDPDVNYRLSMLNHYIYDPSDCDQSIIRLDVK